MDQTSRKDARQNVAGLMNRPNLFISVIAGVGIGAVLMAANQPVPAHAADQSIKTNCIDGVSSLAATSAYIYYACKDRGDNRIYIVLRP